MRKLTLGLALLMILFCFPIFADESLTITTYYPSPYGSYNKLTTARDTYLAAMEGNVGIGTTNPGEKMEVAGNIKSNSLINVGGRSLPGCGSANRGQQWLLQGKDGVEDIFLICMKKADDTYEWSAPPVMGVSVVNDVKASSLPKNFGN